MPPTPASHKIGSQAMIPMWDSSDPRRNPAPLPLNPRDPNSPKTGTPTTQHGNSDSGSSSREVSPVRRGRSDSMALGGPINLHHAPTRSTPSTTPSHKRTTSTQPAPGVRDIQSMFLGPGRQDTSPTRLGTPTPRDLFGNAAAFPLKDREVYKSDYSSASFRKSLDFERTPVLPPLRHKETDINTPPHNQSSLTHFKSLSNLDDTPTKVTVHDFQTLSSQLTGLTTIATTLQREMANLSRRSKDNATDLMSIKEATKTRDEEIRRSLRDLQAGLTSFEATEKLLEGPLMPRLSLAAPSNSSGSDSGHDDDMLVSKAAAAASTQVLDKVLREMPTKDDQDHALHILQDIQNALKTPTRVEGGIPAEERILAVLEEIKEREDSRGKELVVSGESQSREDGDQVVRMLENLRDELFEERREDHKIVSLLEEIKEKGPGERDDERILSAIDELKVKQDGERLDIVISLLEELRDREPSAKVVSLLEEAVTKMGSLSEDLSKQHDSLVRTGFTSSAPTSPRSANDDVVELLKALQESADSNGEVNHHVEMLLQEYLKSWREHDRNVNSALKDLGKEIEHLATEQRIAISRIPAAPLGGLQSHALTTTNPPLPPDLDNEAAITALANIASTTTRTDITLSSINALIKVFQKESQSSSTNNAESLSTMSRYIEDMNQNVAGTVKQSGEARKVLEVVRTGVCSANDKLAEFEGSTFKQLEELLNLQNLLNRSTLDENNELLWKGDLGVRADVAELSDKINTLCDKNVHALREATKTTLGAISGSNPAELIEELKEALGAMAQRSLDAFKRSEDAIQRLAEESANSAQRNIEAIENANPTTSISDLRDEVSQMGVKTLAICESIDAKCGTDEIKAILNQTKEEIAGIVESVNTALAGQNTSLQNMVGKFMDGIDSKIEDVVTTAAAAASSDEKTALALEELKTEVSDTLSKAVALSEKPDGSEKILIPIIALRNDVMDLIEKSNTALATPVHSPQVEEVKCRIETLARDLTEAMENTANIATGLVASNSGAEQHVNKAIEDLRKDIGNMGSSIAAAVASNSASTMEEGIKTAFENMKDTVLVKVEQGLTSSDKAVSDIANLSKDTKESIGDLKKDVMEIVHNSVTMAVTKPETPPSISEEALESLKSEITDVIISSVAAGTGSEEIKELVETLKTDLASVNDQIGQIGERVGDMGKQVAPPASNLDETLMNSLESMRTEITKILGATANLTQPSESSQETAKALDALREQVQDLVGKSSMLVPVTSAPKEVDEEDKPSTVGPKLSEAIEILKANIENLKADVNDMVEKSLVAAIANSTFDSEEKVKEAITELKRDVKDTLEKSMVPAPQQPDEETTRLVREAISVLRQEIAVMFEKRATTDAEDKEDIVSKLESLLSRFGELLEMSTNVEVRETMETLKTQLNGLAEKSPSNDISELKQELADLKGSLPDTSANKELLERLAERLDVLIEHQASSEIKNSLDDLGTKVDNISGTDSLRTAVETLKTEIEAFSRKPEHERPSSPPTDSNGADGVTSTAKSLQAELGDLIEKSTANIAKLDDIAEIKILVEDFKKELTETMSNLLEAGNKLETTVSHEALVTEIKDILAKSLTLGATATTESPSTEASPNKEKVDAIVAAIAELKDEVVKMGMRAQASVVAKSPPSEDENGIKQPGPHYDLTDVASAVGECRVEVAVVKALLEEKSAKSEEDIAILTTDAKETNLKAKEMKEDMAQLAQVQGEVKDETSSVKKAVSELHTESTDLLVGIKTLVEGNHAQTAESISALSGGSADFHGAAKQEFGEVKSTLATLRQETKESFEAHKTVEGVQTEVKELVLGVDKKLETGHSEIKDMVCEVKVNFEDSKTEMKDSLEAMNAVFTSTQIEAKNVLVSVKKLVEEARSADDAHHDRSRKQVDQVLGLVDGLQSEWKGHQPTLFNALLEMKHLLQEVQKTSAKQLQVEPPPTYDDSETQQKLDQLLAGNVAQAKRLPQLDLLDTIQQQVSATSTSISQFLDEQKTLLREDASVKIEAAKLADLELERALSEKRLVEATTEALRKEHDKLSVTVDSLRDEVEDLRARKFALTGEVSGLETAINLRREEMMMMEARSDAIERRMLEGVIEQSRVLLTKPTNKPTRYSKADRDAALRKVKHVPSQTKSKTKSDGTPGRRHLSLSQINNDSPSGSKSSRASLSGGGTLGLGQKEYSASLGLLGRSQSVKHTSYSAGRKASMGNSRLSSGGKENVEHEAVLEEDEIPVGGLEDVVESDDEGSIIHVSEELEDGEESLQRKNRAYPALGLDFSESQSLAGSRNVSGAGSIA